jgi:hypothetical protein
MLHFFGQARQIEISFWRSRNHQRRIPKCEPLLALHHFRRECDAQSAQRRHLLLRQAAFSAGHFELRHQILAERDPLAAVLASLEIANQGLAVADDKPCLQLLAALTCPENLQRAFAHFHTQAIDSFIIFQIALAPREGNAQNCAEDERMSRHAS